jgi:adenylate cyclase
VARHDGAPTVVLGAHTGRMATEIERRYIVESIPSSLAGDVGASIRQGYLAQDGDVELRVRITGGGAVLTVKAGAGRSRMEVELRVDIGDAEELWVHTAGRRIDKTRHRLPYAGRVIELDVFRGVLAGLLIAEVEFPDDAAADAFEPPSWFGIEVTGRPEWSNSSLSRNGRPGS